MHYPAGQSLALCPQCGGGATSEFICHTSGGYRVVTQILGSHLGTIPDRGLGVPLHHSLALHVNPFNKPVPCGSVVEHSKCTAPDASDVTDATIIDDSMHIKLKHIEHRTYTYVKSGVKMDGWKKGGGRCRKLERARFQVK